MSTPKHAVAATQRDPGQHEAAQRDVMHAHRIRSLTGLRTVLIAMTIGTHAAFWTGNYSHTYVGSLLGRLDSGVAAFFALSGFLLVQPWIRTAKADAANDNAANNRAAARGPGLWRYLRGRFRRIGPAYWLLITAVYLGNIDLVPHPDAGELGGWEGYAEHMFFVQAYDVGFVSGLTHTWSLCVEVGLYLLLPFVAAAATWAFRRRGLGGAWAVLAACALITPVWLFVVYQNPSFFPYRATIWFPTSVLIFAAGMAVAYWHATRPRYPRWLGPAALVAALGCFLVAGTTITGPYIVAPQNTADALIKQVLYAGFAAALLVAALAPRPALFPRILSLPVVVYLGEISYEIYLIHVIVLEMVLFDVMGNHLFDGDPFVLFAITTVVTVPLAAALHRLTARRTWSESRAART